MKKQIFLIALLMMMLGVGRSYAQFEDFENDTDGRHNATNGENGGNGNRIIDRLRFGGDFGLGFSTNSFAIIVNPNVGYRFNNYVTAGVMATCEYYKYMETLYYGEFSRGNFGGGVFADIYPIDFLVAHAEMQMISYKDYYSNFREPERKTDAAILVGGGYHRSITDRAGINIMFLWNLNSTQGLENNTSFANPIIRVSLIF